MASRPVQNSYSNPAFCQQSEFFGRSPPKNVRQSPVGAQTPHRGDPPPPNSSRYDEQEFYEEMIVDGRTGAVQEKKFVVMHNERYPPVPPKSRYEYIPMQKQETPPKVKIRYHEEVEASTGVVHRYAVIPPEEEPPKTSGRYALVPIEEIASSRYPVIMQNEIKTNRYEYIDDTYQQNQVISPSPQRRGNPVATQKLHDLLRTPKTPRTPPRRTQSFTSPNRPPPKAQQKLNYTLSTRQNIDKRNTAIVAPICSSPVQSVYSDTTYSKSESWMNLSNRKQPVQMTIAIAAFMMVLCGGVTTGLCFYMISFMGRLYFLDFGVISGFTCLLLGLLGFRSRNVYWLPHRNYISGYFILSVFSLLTCAGLLVLLFVQPKPGSPLADMTSGAVCGISGLSLLLAGLGVVASYCCKVPPPDNRVQHCAQGFSV